MARLGVLLYRNGHCNRNYSIHFLWKKYGNNIKQTFSFLGGNRQSHGVEDLKPGSQSGVSNRVDGQKATCDCHIPSTSEINIADPDDTMLKRLYPCLFSGEDTEDTRLKCV